MLAYLVMEHDHEDARITTSWSKSLGRIAWVLTCAIAIIFDLNPLWRSSVNDQEAVASHILELATELDVILYLSTFFLGRFHRNPPQSSRQLFNASFGTYRFLCLFIFGSFGAGIVTKRF
jgi:hypothetical protein